MPVVDRFARMRAHTEEETKEFVLAWQRAKRYSEILARFGANASSRASKLRRAGVRLKRFPKGRRDGRKHYSVRALNDLIHREERPAGDGVQATMH